MADYRDHYPRIRAAGASFVAVAVDEPADSEALRAHLSLPFPILCDTERRLINHWNIYDPHKLGIAKPAVFIIDANQVVRYAAVDTVARRAAATEIVALLEAAAEASPIQRRVLLPRWSDWRTAIRNGIRR